MTMLMMISRIPTRCCNVIYIISLCAIRPLYCTNNTCNSNSTPFIPRKKTCFACLPLLLWLWLFLIIHFSILYFIPFSPSLTRSCNLTLGNWAWLYYNPARRGWNGSFMEFDWKRKVPKEDNNMFHEILISTRINSTTNRELNTPHHVAALHCHTSTNNKLHENVEFLK